MKNDRTDDRYDFGEEGDPNVIPERDPEFDAWIGKAAPRLNIPNATPSAEMWQAIQAARKTSQEAEAGRVPGVTPLRRNPWRLMSVIAAALLLGVVIDRLVLQPSAGDDERRMTNVAATPSTPIDSADPSRLYRMVATQTLTEAEALLTAYRAGDAAKRDSATTRQLGRWGRDILGSTRLLMDSPAGEDPQLRSLLNDLELVLVQIIQISGAPLDASDRALIERAMEDRNLLSRIRTVIPAGAPVAAGAD